MHRRSRGSQRTGQIIVLVLRRVLTRFADGTDTSSPRGPDQVCRLNSASPGSDNEKTPPGARINMIKEHHLAINGAMERNDCKRRMWFPVKMMAHIEILPHFLPCPGCSREKRTMSLIFPRRYGILSRQYNHARLVKLADTKDLGSFAVRHAGSSPAPRTSFSRKPQMRTGPSRRSFDTRQP